MRQITISDQLAQQLTNIADRRGESINDALLLAVRIYASSPDCPECGKTLLPNAVHSGAWWCEHCEQIVYLDLTQAMLVMWYK